MSSKRKWDQAAPTAEEDSQQQQPSPPKKLEDGKTASEAAAAAVAIAAKIAAQFAQPLVGGTGLPGQKDPFDAEFTHDIDINDVRNRYMLTKGTTQLQVSTAPPFFYNLV
jgi:hypothetical protein